jgi:glycogen operon protein
MNAIPSLSLDYGQASLLTGSPQPLGATWTREGVNFAVYSSGAARIELCLFDASGQHELKRLTLSERTETIWHGFLPAPWGVPGLVYGLRVHGSYDPTSGLR